MIPAKFIENLLSPLDKRLISSPDVPTHLISNLIPQCRQADILSDIKLVSSLHQADINKAPRFSGGQGCFGVNFILRGFVELDSVGTNF